MTETLSNRRQKWVTAFLILGFVAVASLLIYRRFSQENPRTGAIHSSSAERIEGSVLPVFGPAPDFSLIERSGKTLIKKDLEGRPWVADFIFTSCAGQCPFMSLEMKKLQTLFSRDRDLRFVSFSVDPQRDTPPILSEYADHYGAEKERWFFLTGSQKEINRILAGFFLNRVEEPAMHSTRFLLMDGTGQIRGYYDSSEPEGMRQLIHDIQILTQQGPPS